MLNVSRQAAAAKASRRRAVLRLTLVAMMIALVAGGIGLRQWLFQQWPVTPPGTQRVNIATGSALSQIALQLELAGVVGDAERFIRLARWREVTQKIKAGEYEFTKAATPGDVLDRLVAGDVIKIRITIPEGLTLKEIATRVESAGIGTADQFIKAATDLSRLGRLGVPGKSLEGYLFPETYTVTTTTLPVEVVRAMVNQFERQMTPELLAAARNRGLDRHALVTLASIVQKEAGNQEEMPVIAGVFHNRLRKGMRLQADPTVIYGIRDFNGNLTRRDLTTPTPYNTYTRAGLPPGPIASPGLAALNAAANPATSSALYFVARGDGRHEFNVTLVAHNRAVRRYQLRGR
jgi:UPF0755 protein